MLSRRDVLTAILGAPLGAALSACAPDKRARAPIEGAFVEPSMKAGHLLRTGSLLAAGADEVFARAPSRNTSVAILGGGPSGLSAGWQLMRQGITDFELLELEGDLGGTSASGRAETTAYPWGAHYITTPLAEHTDLVALLREMNALDLTVASPHPAGREELLVRELKERVFYKGYFYPGLYLRVGASPDDLAQLERFEALLERYAALRDGQGRRAFAIPVETSSDDAELIQLDAVSAADWLRGQGFSSQRLLKLLDYACRDDYGLSLETASAWSLLFYFAARKDPAHDHESEVITWPEGNGALVQHLSARFKERVRTGKLVVDVIPRGDRTHVHVLDVASQKPEVVIARRVIVATPRFVATRIVRPLRERPLSNAEPFSYGAWLVANLHLHTRPSSRGAPPAWDNVLYDSPSLGYVCATHQRGRDFGPTVFTYYLPMVDEDPRQGRQRLHDASFQQLADAVCSDIERAHPDLRACLARVDLCRFGHGMVQPRVGHVWSSARRAAAAPLEGIHFAHSDLSGIALFEEAFHHGVRAAREVAAALG
jgi:phytoene dehydrogenase-like protein